MSRFLPVALTLIAVCALPLAAQQPPSSAGGTATKVLAGKPNKHYGLTVIQGNALDSTNGPLSNVLVRLRDARFGRIVDTQLTDKSGLFTFRGIEPGTYVVEIVANDQSILAASQLLNVNAGEALSAIVKLPLRIPPFAGVIGAAGPSSATVIATQAVASGIVALVPTSPVSPNQ
jgi:hypothetical protein